MTTGRKTIKKPSFIITYSISFVIMFVVLGFIGTLIYLIADFAFKGNADTFRLFTEKELDCEIADYLNKDKNIHDVTGKQIAGIKESLVNHYSKTGQYIQVLFDGERIADSSQTAIMTYYISDELSYTLEIADKKYLEYFNTPEVNRFKDNAVYGSELEALRHQPVVHFNCDEFYVDLENYKFIPVVSRIVSGLGESGPVIRISPDENDLKGFTLIKITEEIEKTDMQHIAALGTVAGCEVSVSEDQMTELYDISNGYDKSIGMKKTFFSTKYFYDVYRSRISIGIILFAVCVVMGALISSTIRYNINKRNYEIYEYRRQTTNAMAHDLKTPIASIIAYSELLENNVDAGNRELYLAKISETAAQMNNSVNNILQFSRSENAAIPVSKSEVKVAEIVKNIISDNEQKIGEKGLKVDFDEKTAPTLNTDKELFRQALGNLINNAVLYSKDNTSVTIECNDEGIKITNVMAEPVEDINKIKEPFIKGSSSRENGGTGLGLAIAENDLAMLKYTLNVKTENELFVCTVDFK